MFLTLFPKRSESGFEVLRQRHNAEAKAEMLEARLNALANAYIKESPRPDCLPEMRFRVTMSNGTMAYCRTYEEARGLFLHGDR